MSIDCHIVIIDDHEIVATGCQAEFARFGLSWEVTWARSLSDVVWPQGRAVAVLDLRLNDGSQPEEVIAELERRSIPVVIYTSGEDPKRIREAISAGVMAIVNKASPFEELIDAIKAALRGEPSGSVDWANALDMEDDFMKQLTPREIEVISLYANGVQADRVARSLNLSRNTVTRYIAQIKAKFLAAGLLKDGGRVELSKAAAKIGLISYYE
ncbi:response regulator transcription factor [Actinomyces sp.]|uniref:response regulator transcription factor n=1 Tax=Actinomyces sp. TaxID=29317 RepID=UPI0026DD2FEA|nr:response regulator transcription factor [Actinomyces sp.]